MPVGNIELQFLVRHFFTSKMVEISLKTSFFLGKMYPKMCIEERWVLRDLKIVTDMYAPKNYIICNFKGSSYRHKEYVRVDF